MPRLSNDRVRDRFVESLERTRRAYGFRVYGYAVMPEHVHLLVSETGFSDSDSGLEDFRRAPGDPLSGARSGYYFLAEALLRPQRAQLREFRSEAALRSSQSGHARTGRKARRLEVEQLSALPYGRTRPGGDRVSLDSRSPDRKNSKTIAASKRLNANQRPHICRSEQMWVFVAGAGGSFRRSASPAPPAPPGAAPGCRCSLCR